MPKYLVTGRVFGAGGELLDGKEVNKKGDVDHPAFTKVTATQAKKAKKADSKLEVATPKKSDDK